MNSEELFKPGFQGSTPPALLENVAISVKKEELRKVLSRFKEAGFDHLSDVTCVDYPDEGEFEIIYHLWSLAEKCRRVVKVRLPRESPSIKSVSNICLLYTSPSPRD